MIITHAGKNSFKIQSGSLAILVNPHNDRAKADITIQTTVPADNLLSSEKNSITGGGEYEIQGITVTGYNSGHADNATLRTVYAIEFEQFHIGVLDDLPELPTDSDAVEHLTSLDILILPSPSVSVIKRLQPKIVVFSGVSDWKPVQKEIGQKAEQVDKLVIKHKDVPVTGPKLIVLA